MAVWSMPALMEDFAWEEQVGNSLIVREPVGVVASITPWNYPLHQLSAKVSAALAAGCTIVAKPSEVTPLSSLLVAEIGVTRRLAGLLGLSHDPVRVGAEHQLLYLGSEVIGQHDELLWHHFAPTRTPRAHDEPEGATRPNLARVNVIRRHALANVPPQPAKVGFGGCAALRVLAA